MGFSLSRVADGGRSFAFLAAAAATFVFAFAAAASRRQKVLVDGKRSSGSVVSMWIAGATSQPMERKPTIRCIAGVGIEGDRYSRSLESGRYSVFPEPGRQITIIAAEPMETLQRDLRLDIGPHNCRRNVVVRGFRPELRHCIGHRVRLGEVELFVHRIAFPCMYLEGLIKAKGLADPWWLDSGINCEILRGGQVSESDRLELVPDSYDPGKIVNHLEPAIFVRPSERSSAERNAMLLFRRGLEEKASTGDALFRKKLRLFDQGHGRKNSSWDGGLPQW